jgi:2-methylcitrate dehydratase
MHAIATSIGAGKMLGLTEEQLHNAISMAVVANVCLQQTRVGELSNWKGMAGPYGSRGGLLAAMMAKHGITSTSQPFEGKRGFMNQLNSPFEVGQMGGKGTPFKMEETFFKYIPVMYCAALPVWAGIELKEKLNIEEIESIDLHAYSFIMATDTYAPERADPKTRETADHSLPYLIAAAIVDGAITEKTMTPERYRDPTILGIAKKIRVVEDPKYSAEYPKTIHVRLEAKLKSGKVVTADQINPKGHPTNPMSDKEIEEKFLELVDPVWDAKQSKKVLDALWNLEKLPNLDELMTSMVVKGRR